MVVLVTVRDGGGGGSFVGSHGDGDCARVTAGSDCVVHLTVFFFFFIIYVVLGIADVRGGGGC